MWTTLRSLSRGRLFHRARRSSIQSVQTPKFWWAMTQSATIFLHTTKVLVRCLSRRPRAFSSQTWCGLSLSRPYRGLRSSCHHFLEGISSQTHTQLSQINRSNSTNLSLWTGTRIWRIWWCRDLIFRGRGFHWSKLLTRRTSHRRGRQPWSKVKLSIETSNKDSSRHHALVLWKRILTRASLRTSIH